MLSVEESGIKTIFWVLGITWSGIESQSPEAIGEHSTHSVQNQIKNRTVGFV